MSEFLELKIPIGPTTTKKIVALAALTGQSLPEIKDAIAADLVDEQAFDEFVSGKLHYALAELDGGDGSEEAEEESTYKIVFRKPKSFHQAEQESNNVIEDIAGHSLSGDADTGAPSLQEQYESEEQKLRAQPPAPQPVRAQPTLEEKIFANEEDFESSDNIDDFLDMSAGNVAPKAAKLPEPAKAKPAPRGKRTVKVSAYTGDEDAPLF